MTNEKRRSVYIDQLCSARFIAITYINDFNARHVFCLFVNVLSPYLYKVAEFYGLLGFVLQDINFTVVLLNHEGFNETPKLYSHFLTFLKTKTTQIHQT